MKQIIKSILVVAPLFLFSCTDAQEVAKKDNKTSTSKETKVSNIAKNVNAQEFKQLIEKGNGNLVDVRTPGEFTRGNIEGAKNINIAGNFSEEIQKLDKNKPVYVYCAVGGRSARAMQMMKQMGFKEVYNLMGGYNAWSRQ